MSKHSSSLPRLLLQLAPALFVVLWSTGFIGAKFGLPYAEPFTFLLLRLIFVTLLLSGVALAARAPWPSWRLAGHLTVAGLLVHAVYLGGVFAAISHGLPSAMTALIVGLQPLLTAALASKWMGEKVGPRQWLGLVLGLIGVGMVVWKKLSFGSDSTAILFAVAALVGITIGTLYQKRYCGGMDLRTGTVVQYLTSGIVLGLVAASTETMHVDWSPSFIFALAWLVVVLSVGAIFLLFLLIRQGQAARVASLFYMTPPTTALMAWALFGETLPPLALAGFVVVAAGVALARKG
ncbi:MAG TPA: DMT family transporter [Candidatus Sulfotelmatobacter sp.]|jgi:drug/metabolite transporter (DMT)-like permease|nr:DMT family transporter [Candidatus Sulfotelmatobacter sp.]